MGIAADDYSGDGRVDLLVTNSRDQRHAVYESSPSGRFGDVRSEFGSAFGGAHVGWGDAWADLDLDGRLDLVLANGAIPVKDLEGDAQPLQVLWNRRGGFAEADAGPKQRLKLNGRGLATADYDNDGDLDVAANTIGGRLLLFENTNPRGRWLEVALHAFHPGAVVTAVLPDGRKLVREVHAGSSYLSSEDPRVHFGLGNAKNLGRLVVRYPGGKTRIMHDVAVDRVVHVD